ncbi:MAG TPA: sulfotransferase domain-containing protein [Steroidobacteraceae bacterium]|nr:sulfotransferase domain-containing protein [Steroidobacteraceae bacterium]
MSDAPKNIVWIASYPKSGNTWVRFMACNLLYGRQESAAAVSVLAPDIHERGRELIEGAHAGLVKTHFACSPSMPMVERTAAAIYIVRTPEDVIVSNFFYAQRSTAAAPTADSRIAFDQYFDAFVSNRGDPRWARLGMGSWEDNVRSWLEAPHPFPVLAIRFEDLAADAQRVGSMLAQLVRPQSSAEEIRRAVDNSSFQRLKEIEEADIGEKRQGIFYKPYLEPSIQAGRRFMRRGSVGAAELTQEQRARLGAAFGPLLAKLGYTRT